MVNSAEPSYEPLYTLLKLHRPVSRSKGRDLVVWIDDAHSHVHHGLTRDNLRRLVERYPEVIIVLIIHSSRLEGIKDLDAPLHALLRKPFDDLEMKPGLIPLSWPPPSVRTPDWQTTPTLTGCPSCLPL